MIEVQLIDKFPNEIMDIVKDMRKSGLVQGIDFDFSYHQPKYDWYSGDAVYNRHTTFIFYKEELATYFRLMYE